jgi:hypothetical protein
MKKCFAALLSALAFILAPIVVVQACGPFFSPDTFVYPLHPDHPKLFATGKLGVLLPTYPRADLFVAWRYLTGASLTADEQNGYHPIQSNAEIETAGDTDDASRPQDQSAQPPEPADLWLKARNRYAAPQTELQVRNTYNNQSYPEGFILVGSYENCQQDAFRAAVSTLDARAKTWGPKSLELADWIKAQDAVFARCQGQSNNYGLPSNTPKTEPAAIEPAPPSAPLLLRQDRAYQAAAALFYANAFEPALAAFRAISQDAASPWRGLARYMVARTLVRQAFLTAPPAKSNYQANFIPALLRQAQTELESMRHESLPGVSTHAVGGLLNFVRYRTEPQARLRELASALASPDTDPDYEQDLIDLTLYLNNNLDDQPLRADADDSSFKVDRDRNDYRPLIADQKHPGYEKAFQDAAPQRALGEMVDWAITLQSPSTSAQQHALAEWKRTQSVPWLLAALTKSSVSDPDAPALIEAASRIPSTSPAYVTAAYHRIRLLAGAGRMDEARLVLAAAQPAFEASGSDGAMNLLSGLRMKIAPTLSAALVAAPRKVLERGSEEHAAVRECLWVMKNPNRKYDCKPITGSTEFAPDAVAILNNEMPLSSLIATAESKSLPADQRDAVAIMTWVRAVLLGDARSAARVFLLLPAKLQQQAGPGVGFHPLMALLRNPGLRPYLDEGTQRSRSYDFVESYSNNWWNRNWRTNWNSTSLSRPTTGPLGFLSPQTRAEGQKQSQAVYNLGSSNEVLGTRTVAWAQAHPADPDVPEALYLVLRMVRYGCGENYETRDEPDAAARAKRVDAMLVEVGHLMRQRYSTSPWTKKAAPFGGLTHPTNNN